MESQNKELCNSLGEDNIPQRTIRKFVRAEGALEREKSILSRTRQVAFFCGLPRDVWGVIAEFITEEESSSFSLTCKEFRVMNGNNLYWRTQTAFYGCPLPVTQLGQTYRTTYAIWLCNHGCRNGKNVCFWCRQTSRRLKQEGMANLTLCKRCEPAMMISAHRAIKEYAIRREIIEGTLAGVPYVTNTGAGTILYARSDIASLTFDVNNLKAKRRKTEQ